MKAMLEKRDQKLLLKRKEINTIISELSRKEQPWLPLVCF